MPSNQSALIAVFRCCFEDAFGIDGGDWARIEWGNRVSDIYAHYADMGMLGDVCNYERLVGALVARFSVDEEAVVRVLERGVTLEDLFRLCVKL